MNILMVGDIVGPDATAYLAGRLPELRRAHDVDLVIANGENCAITAAAPVAGFGMTTELVDLLLGSGVDVLTSGNHGWDGPRAAAVHRHPRVLRPHNVPAGLAGKGLVTLEVGGEPVSVLNLASERGLLPDALPVYAAWRALARRGTVIVDFHGDSAWEKMIFATAIDGEAAAVLGTHTHEPTRLLHLLPGGTAFVADVGMTGPTGSPGGFPLRHFAAAYRGEDAGALPPFALASGPMTLGAVWLRVEGGRARELRRVDWPTTGVALDRA